MQQCESKGNPPTRALVALFAKSSPGSIAAAVKPRHLVNRCPRRVQPTYCLAEYHPDDA
jgi:hypothetical protein